MYSRPHCEQEVESAFKAKPVSGWRFVPHIFFTVRNWGGPCRRISVPGSSRQDFPCFEQPSLKTDKRVNTCHRAEGKQKQKN